MSLSIPTRLSFSKTLSSQNPFSPFNFSISPSPFHKSSKPTIIRMGGGPRTYPGGVSKLRWKRMQAKKAKQLLKAGLARERQIYEMRKRAELKAAVSELERPWEVVRRAPTLFSVKADEQVKVLADQFQKPGGFDMWTERDGPQLFETPDGFPSARFFPKGVVHSVKHYGFVFGDCEFGVGNLNSDEIDSEFGGGNLGADEIGSENELVNTLGRELGRGRRNGNGKLRRMDSDFDSEIESGNELVRTSGRGLGRDRSKRNGVLVNGRLRTGFETKNNDVDLMGMEESSDSGSEFEKNLEMKSRSRNGGSFRKQGSRNRFSRGGLGSSNSDQVGSGRNPRGDGTLVRGGGTKMNTLKIDYRTGRRNINDNGTGKNIRNSRYSKTEVFDLEIEQDGSYGFQAKTRQLRSENAGN